jgi:tetratricopeptide (TPR) repeat protein
MIVQSVTPSNIMQRVLLIGASFIVGVLIPGCATQTSPNSNPNLAMAYSHSAVTDIATGNYDAALADCNKAIALNPNEIGAYSNRGIVRQHNGDLDGAISDYSTAMAMGMPPNDTYTGSDQTKGPIFWAAVNKAIAQVNIQTALIDRGIAKQIKGDLVGAIADYSKTLELNVELNGKGGELWAAYAYADRSAAEEAEGDHAAAVADHQKAIALNPHLGTGLLSISRTLANAQPSR